MTEAATVAQASARAHAKAAAASAVDAAKVAVSKTGEVAKTAYAKGNGYAQAGMDRAAEFGKTAKESGFWKTVGAKAYKHPLIAGAALITTAYVATHAFAGPKQQRVVNERAASQGLER